MKKLLFIFSLLILSVFLNSCKDEDTPTSGIGEEDLLELTAGPYNTSISYIAVDNSDRLYAPGRFMTHDISGYEYENVFMMSQDKGSNWRNLVNNNSDSISSILLNDFYDIIIHREKSRSYYKSSDLGASWSKIADSVPGVNRYYLSGTDNKGNVFFTVIFKTDSGNIVYKHGLSKSSDNGKTWVNVLELQSGGIESFTSDKNGILYLLIINDIDNYSLYKSTDNGSNWVQTGSFKGNFPSGIYNQPFKIDKSDNFYLLNSFISTDSGASWKSFGTKGLYGEPFCSMDVTNKGNIYLATSVGIYRSTDKGQSWSFVLKSHSIRMIKFDSKSNLYVLMGNSMIYRSKKPFE